ncbi:MAG: sulfatase-like hydrolase/transferase [Roseibacillus sp.]
MKPFHKSLQLGTLLAVTGLAITSSSAASRTWDGSTSTSYNVTTNWSGDDIPDNNDSGILAGGGSGITDLSGGITPSTASALNIRSGHVFNIDNNGGTLNVNNNVNVGRGVAGDGSTINHSAGEFNIGGIDMSGNPDGGTSFYDLSGTAALSVGFNNANRTFNIGGDLGVGDFDSTFAIAGDSASITVNGSALELRSSAILEFTLGATGIDAVDTTGNLLLQSGAALTIDGSSYTGGAGTIPLFSYGSRTDATEFAESITGFAGFTTDITYETTSINLVLTSTTGGPQITSFSAAPTQISVGESTILSWATAGATSLTLDPGGLNVTGTTELAVSPTTTTTYTLTASDGNSSVMETAEITVTSATPGNSISVNFHANDSDALADHQLTSGESAGLTPLDGSHWNNISLGNAQANNGAIIFSPTDLIDDVGNSSAATISSTLNSGTSGSWFVGYAASSANDGNELSNGIGDDNLFNSYLATNTADNFSLSLTGLGTEFTSEGYSLIIYSDSDRRNASANDVRQSLYTLTPNGGSAITGFVEDDDAAAVANIFDGTYLASDGIDDGADYSNYVVFTGLNAANFTLAIDSPDGGRGAISGFQVIAGDVVVATPPSISTFEATPSFVAPGTPVQLSWTTTNADTLTLDPGNNDVTGLTSFSLSATATTTYTLTATNAEGSVSEDLTVNVGFPPNRPNIILCLVDDWGVMDTSVPFSYENYIDSAQPVVRGFNNFYHTPNLEQLAADGMIFTQAYALPVCSPTRVSLMTGLNAPAHGVTVHLNRDRTYERPSGSNVSTHRSPNGWRFQGMNTTETSLPRLLSAQGYRSIHCGKAHIGSNELNTADPLNIGFDINLGGSEGGSPGRYIGNPGYSSGNNQVPNIEAYQANGRWLTEALTEAVGDSMEDAVNDGVPFFTYMSYYAVHSPFTNNPNATGDYSAAVSTNHNRFATMIEGVDTSLGQIRAKLEALGVAENTLILFTGDNGSDSPALSSRNQIGNNGFQDYPIRGKKANCYEGGYHVPLFAAWSKPDPNNAFQQELPIGGGTVEHDIVSVVDLTTTILSVADVPHPAMDGVDLSPYLSSTPGTHREQTLLRHQPNSQNSSFFTAYRRDDYKLIYFYYEDDADQFELYDLATDRDESNDLSSSNPQLVLELAREMAAALDTGWGDYGALWPTFSVDASDGDASRPLADDPFLISFAVDGRDLVDSDMDGLLDAIEDLNQDGLVDSTETNSDNPDTDGDSNLDGDEVRTGTNPLDANSFFSLCIERFSATSVLLTWPSAQGARYDIQGSTDFSFDTTLEGNFPASSSASSTSVEVTMPLGEARYFFQVELLP